MGCSEDAMKNHILLIIVLFSTLNIAFARKPAVEDFVGIEPKGTDFSKPGTEGTFTPYNFSQSGSVFNQNSSTNSYAVWVLFGMVATLPLMSWFILSKGKNSEMDASNVHHLKDYRQDDHNDQDDDISKAS